MKNRTSLITTIACSLLTVAMQAQDFAAWVPQPVDWKGATIANGTATLIAEKWRSLRSTDEHADAELTATITIATPAS